MADSHSFESGSLSEPGARLTTQEAPVVLLFLPTADWAHRHTPLSLSFTVAEIRTRVLIFVQQSRLTHQAISPVPVPWFPL